MPLIQALDANHDGVIDANEIANAIEALKSLDKNGDGKLTPDEYMPKPPKPPQDGDQAVQSGRSQNNTPPPPPGGGPGGPGGPGGGPGGGRH